MLRIKIQRTHLNAVGLTADDAVWPGTSSFTSFFFLKWFRWKPLKLTNFLASANQLESNPFLSPVVWRFPCKRCFFLVDSSWAKLGIVTRLIKVSGCRSHGNPMSSQPLTSEHIHIFTIILPFADHPLICLLYLSRIDWKDFWFGVTLTVSFQSSISVWSVWIRRHRKAQDPLRR